MIYAAGLWAKSYYLFAIGLLWNNFFGNTAGVAAVYFGQLFKDKPAERDAYVGMVLAMQMLGATIGALVVSASPHGPGHRPAARPHRPGRWAAARPARVRRTSWSSICYKYEAGTKDGATFCLLQAICRP